jgi:hypothetical protein
MAAAAADAQRKLFETLHTVRLMPGLFVLLPSCCESIQGRRDRTCPLNPRKNLAGVFSKPIQLRQQKPIFAYVQAKKWSASRIMKPQLPVTRWRLG